MKPRFRDDLVTVELDSEAVIYDEQTGDLHHLNPTATIVMQLCDGTVTVPQLSREIAEAFDVEVEQVRPQVRDLVREFRRAGLLADGQGGRPAERESRDA